MTTKALILGVLLVEFGNATVLPEAPKQKPQPADVVFWNGAIYPLAQEGAISCVEALVTRKDRIIFTGTKADVEAYVVKSTRIVDLKGRAVMPGFTDAHCHPLAGALINATCDLSTSTNLDTIRSSLQKYAVANEEKSWIVGMNVWEPAFLNAGSPRRILDGIITNRPVVLLPASGHEAWLNSKALELVRITAATPDPPKGRIDRETGSREPNGALHEDVIQQVLSALPPPSEEERRKALRDSLHEANSYGIINMVDARVDEADITTYRSLAESGELTAHMSLAVYVDVSRGLDGVRQALNAISRFRRGSELPNDLSLQQVKIYLDGTVEGKSAAMLEPYVGETNSGLPLADSETVKAVIAALDKEKLQIQVHAIGDRAIRMALDGFEHARKVNGIRDSRHQIAHLHVVHPDDVPRFRSLAVVANFQGCWADGDSEYVTRINAGLLGPTRAEWQYPMGSIARTGAMLVFGSDWPVSTMDPLRAIQIAVTRRQPDGKEMSPWTPQHLIDLAPVLTGFTRNGAWVTFREQGTGTLEPGKFADLVVLDADPFKLPKFQIFLKAKVQKTMFRGRFVFERE